LLCAGWLAAALSEAAHDGLPKTGIAAKVPGTRISLYGFTDQRRRQPLMRCGPPGLLQDCGRSLAGAQAASLA
jgi:hypothetical protein